MHTPEIPPLPAAREVRFALVDADDRFRSELECHAASRHLGVRCVATFQSILTTPTSLLKHLAVGAMVLDPAFPGLQQATLIQFLRTALPDCPIVILSHDDTLQAILTALKAGADGYLLKSDSLDDTLQRLRDVASKGTPMSPRVSRLLWTHNRSLGPAKQESHPQLTLRESRVMEKLATGARYKEAADQLGISENTLRSHVRNTYRKLRVGTLLEAIRKLHPE